MKKNTNSKMTTMMMITAATLIGTVGLGAQSAFADTIDFESFSELDNPGAVATATNTVTFKVDDSSNPDLTLLPNGVVVSTGDPRYGFGAASPDGVTGQVGTNSLSNNIAEDTNINNWIADDYVILFDFAVENLSLDVYDFGDYPSVNAPGSITLNVYSDSAATVLVGTDSVDTSAGGDDSIVALYVGSPSSPIMSAKIVDSKGDIGTAIDNVTFDTYNIDLGEECSDGDEICKSATAIDANTNGFIEVGELVFFMQEITVSNPDDGIDWEETMVTDNFGAEIQNITCDEGNIEDKKGKSEKHSLIWDIEDLADNTSTSNSCDSQTGLDPSGEQWYTECGVHEYNSGAVVKAQVPKDNGKGTKQISFNTESILVEVFTVDKAGDCDGDGLTDDVDPEPFVFNDEDGDGVGDGNDQCPFDVDEGLGFDADGCAIPNP